MVCFWSGSAPHARDSDGSGDRVSAERVRGEQLRGPGFVAGGRGAGRHSDQWLRSAGAPPPAHRVRALPDGARRRRTTAAVQRPATQRRVQPRPARATAHVLPDTAGPVLRRRGSGVRGQRRAPPRQSGNHSGCGCALEFVGFWETLKDHETQHRLVLTSFKQIWPWSTDAVIRSTAIDNNTLYGSKLWIFIWNH